MKTISNDPSEAIPQSLQRILVIDDDDLIVQSLRQQMVERGLIVDYARERWQAVDLLDAISYDVILLDCHLTGLSVQDAPSLIQDVTSRQPDASVILLTSYNSPALEQFARRRGIETILDKPKPVQVLLELVIEHLHRRAGRSPIPGDV